MKEEALRHDNAPGGLLFACATGSHRAWRGRAGVFLVRCGARSIDGPRCKGLDAASCVAGLAQLVERQVVVLDVTGSSPVTRPTSPEREVCHNGDAPMVMTVAIGGLGAIGLAVARALDRGVPGLRLVAVSAKDRAKAAANVAGFRDVPRVVGLAELAAADIVVEAAPAAVFEQIAGPALDAGRIFVPSSVGQLLPRMHLVARAQATGARIVVPTGALLGLDAVRAAAEGDVSGVTIETRKPPGGLVGAPYLEANGIDVLAVREATVIFEGNAFDAAAGFPANVNVAAALALAGIGPQRTMVRIWADPGVDRNIHTIRVESEAARLTMTVENVPSEANPKTGKLTPLSVLACLRGLTSTLKVGS